MAIRVADLEGNGVPDVIILSASGVTVYRGNGQGGFLPDLSLMMPAPTPPA